MRRLPRPVLALSAVVAAAAVAAPLAGAVITPTPGTYRGEIRGGTIQLKVVRDDDRGLIVTTLKVRASQLCPDEDNRRFSVSIDHSFTAPPRISKKRFQVRTSLAKGEARFTTSTRIEGELTVNFTPYCRLPLGFAARLKT